MKDILCRLAIFVAAFLFSCTRADFNGDGQVDLIDTLAYMNAYTAGDLRADMDGDKMLTAQDQQDFAILWGRCHEDGPH
jgi:hypothetical protein